jgi:hypothetical protein
MESSILKSMHMAQTEHSVCKVKLHRVRLETKPENVRKD